eukprot:2215699-Rhodomonas_salina.3
MTFACEHLYLSRMKRIAMNKRDCRLDQDCSCFQHRLTVYGGPEGRRERVRARGGRGPEKFGASVHRRAFTGMKQKLASTSPSTSLVGAAIRKR